MTTPRVNFAPGYTGHKDTIGCAALRGLANKPTAEFP
jgi:hypothetical protein